MTTTVRDQNSRQNQPDVLSRALAQAYTLNWEAIAYVIIFVVAIFTRFYMLGDRVMSHDESLHTRYSYNLAEDGNFQHTPLMHGPLLFHITALFYFLFGANDFTSRIYPAVLGVLIIMMPVLFRRWLGRWGALLASIMLLISPITLYYNRYIRHDTPNIFFSLLMIYGMFMYLSGPENQRQRAHWLYLISGSMLLSLASKETSFIYIAIFGIYLAIYWFIRLAQRYLGAPGKTTFFAIIMAFCVGGVAALAMFVTLSVNLGERPFLQALETLTSYRTFVIWTLVVIGFVALITISTVQAGFRNAQARLGVREGLLFFVLSFIVSTILIVFEELSRLSHNTTGVSEPVVPDGAGGEVIASTLSYMPIILLWVVGALLIVAMVVTWRRGLWATMQTEFPEFDVIIIIGSLILPWAAPFVIAATGADPTDYTTPGIQRAIAALIPMFAISSVAGLLWNWKKWTISLVIFYALFTFFFTTMFTNPNGLATGLIGSLGYWLEQQEVRRGNQPQYYYLTIILPMYEFLPLLGSIFATFGGLTWFWRFRRNRLEEQRSAAMQAVFDEDIRGREDSSDESDIVEIEDEYDPLGATSIDMTSSDEVKRKEKAEWLDYLPFWPFVSWWAILNLVGYTLAGEKMPWLAIHLTLPMILLSAWFFGRIFNRIDLRRFLNLGWLYLLLLPLLFVLFSRLVGAMLFGEAPFTGLEKISLAQTGRWLADLALLIVVAIGVYALIARTGWTHLRHMVAVSFFVLMSVLTFRSAWMASFINFDLANEYLVYAHGAPAVKWVLDDIEELSRRTTGGLDLEFIYDNEVSWPYSWYFRDFQNAKFVGSSANAQQVDNAVVAVIGEANRAKFEPLLEDRYYRYEYIRLWWPMQDYFNMTPDRVSNTFSLLPSNTLGQQLRRGLWDIWWARDYTSYGEAVNRDFSLTSWPVSDRMHFYVRKDFASQIWDLGTGDGLVENPLAAEDMVNICNANWQPVAAELIIGDSDEIRLIHPIGVDVSDDGYVYVVEQFAHRISIFTTEGEFVGTLGQPGRAYDANGNFLGNETTTGLFERPNAVALGPDGNLYIADTWNYRVQVMTPNEEVLSVWGERGEYGASARTEPTDGLWGPRDVIVDAANNVYVADTGNKRIRVYTSNGTLLYDIGESGSADGQLNEPSGLALHPDGRLYVADTWNRRIAVFDTLGNFITNFRVRAWYNDQGNRPYLAVDSSRNMLYVTDPDAARVLVYDLDGNCLGSFGQPATSDDVLLENEFRIAGGVTVDALGNVYVVDSGAGRVLKFPPFVAPLSALEEGQNEEGNEALMDPQEAENLGIDDAELGSE